MGFSGAGLAYEDHGGGVVGEGGGRGDEGEDVGCEEGLGLRGG